MVKSAPSKSALIKAVLAQVDTHGWSATALDAAEKAESLTKGTMHAYFPAGLSDFTRAFHAWVDEGMEKQLAKDAEFATAKVREKIFKAVMARLVVLKPYRDAVARLMARQIMPWNAPQGMASLAKSADAMWRAAGDRSIDYNYYTKRFLLSGVYAATLRIWVKDEAGTEDYLRARIEDVLKVGQAIGGLKERFKKTAA